MNLSLASYRLKYVFGLICLALALAGCPKAEDKAEHGTEDKHDEHGKEDKHDEHGKEDKHDKHGKGDKHDEQGKEDKHDEHEEGVVELTADAFKRIKISTQPAGLREMAAVLETTGQVAFDQDRVAHVSPRIAGRVYRVKAKLGDTVKARQSLAVIDSIELGRAKASYLQSRAELNLAKQHLAREETLLKEKISSARDVINVRAAHQKALAGYRAARQRLRLLGLTQGTINRLRYDKSRAALLSLVSPIAGIVTKKHITLGELVTPASNLFTVADLSSVWIWIDVYERDLARVHLQDLAQVRVAAYPGRVFSGKVAFISSEVDRDTRAVRARLDIKNADRVLKPGMFTRVRLSDPHSKNGKSQRRSVLVVPTSAIQRQDKQHVVFVELALRRYQRRVVAVGVEAGGFSEILRGVKTGERVVTRGAFILKSEASKKAMGGGHSH